MCLIGTFSDANVAKTEVQLEKHGGLHMSIYTIKLSCILCFVHKCPNWGVLTNNYNMRSQMPQSSPDADDDDDRALDAVLYHVSSHNHSVLVECHGHDRQDTGNTRSPVEISQGYQQWRG